MAEVRYRLPPDTGADLVTAALRSAVAAVDRGPNEILRQWLDTFDWRLWAGGGRLALETAGGADPTLRWLPPGDEPEVSLPAGRAVRRSTDLPDTLAGRAISQLIGVRALLPMAASRVVQRRIEVRDRRDKTVARVAVERCRDLGPDDRPRDPGRTTVVVAGMAGFDRALRTVHSVLADGLGLEPEEADELALAAAASGRTPGDYRSRPRLEVGPEEPAEAAVRRYLTALLGVIEANLRGIREDLDIEFLHDFRVAVRRSRAAIGQLKDVVPRETRDRWGPDLRWLGRLTGPCRDLDVYLQELGGLAREAGLSDRGELAPFVSLLERQRAEAHRTLVTSLGSARFRSFVAGWREDLGRRFEGDHEQPLRGVRQVARSRVRRAYRRVVSRGAELGPESPAGGFHALRIDAKKLRYLLELFAGVLDTERAEAAIKELKQLQDVLGGLQDVAVQRHRLRDSAEAVAAHGGSAARAVLAMGRLTVVLDARERRLREAFRRCFEPFAGAPGRSAFSGLLDSREGS